MQPSTHCDSDSSTLPEQTDDEGFASRLRLLRKRATDAGSVLHRLATGGFVLIARNGWSSRELRDLHCVSQTLSRIDGRPS